MYAREEAQGPQEQGDHLVGARLATSHQHRSRDAAHAENHFQQQVIEGVEDVPPILPLEVGAEHVDAHQEQSRPLEEEENDVCPVAQLLELTAFLVAAHVSPFCPSSPIEAGDVALRV